eukprot:1159255-Pelagomonas_calceolata.AAC.3
MEPAKHTYLHGLCRHTACPTDCMRALSAQMKKWNQPSIPTSMASADMPAAASSAFMTPMGHSCSMASEQLLKALRAQGDCRNCLLTRPVRLSKVCKHMSGGQVLRVSIGTPCSHTQFGSQRPASTQHNES